MHAKVSEQGYWQGQYLGNALRDLFEDIGFLEDGFGNDRIPLMQPYINAMKSFDAVREACFGMELHDDYATTIEKFRDDYLILFNDYVFSVIVKAYETFHTRVIIGLNFLKSNTQRE